MWCLISISIFNDDRERNLEAKIVYRSMNSLYHFNKPDTVYRRLKSSRMPRKKYFP